MPKDEEFSVIETPNVDGSILNLQLILNIRGRPIGTCDVIVFQTIDEALIDDLTINPAWRRRGYGSWLIIRAERLLKQRKIWRVSTIMYYDIDLTPSEIRAFFVRMRYIPLTAECRVAYKVIGKCPF